MEVENNTVNTEVNETVTQEVVNNEVTEVTENNKSGVLSTEQMDNINSGKDLNEGIETQLPSDTFEIPEKFKDKSVEEIAKAYVELEKLQGNKETTTEEVKETEETTKLNKENIENIISEYHKNGNEVTEEMYKQLNDSGYNKEYVDLKLEKMQTEAQNNVNTLLKDVGGLDEYTKALEWASANLPEEEKVSFNNAINGVNDDAYRIMATTLINRHKSSQTTNEPILEGTRSSKPKQGYNNRTEYSKDRYSNAYKNDATFRNEVDLKLLKSTFS